MHRHQRPLWGAPLRMATCLALAGAAMAAHAQPPDTLAQAFEQAWATQPLPQALSARRSALAASRQAADAWTAQPAALELRTKTDRPGTDRGAQELEVGVALPLWLPGQRSRSQALVTQEEQALDARLDSARLQLAGQVREAWWAWQRARAELAQARAEGQSVQAWQALQGLLGSAQPWPSAAPSTPGPTGAEPTPGEVSADLAQHPLVRDLDQQAATARQPQQAQATLDGAQARWRAAQRAHEAAQRRATLAHETQAFFDKSFRLGETDLPTRLRIAQEAQEAARQASLAAIDLAAAASAWRQAAGLLPQ